MNSGHISASLCLHMHPCTSTDWFSLSVIYEGKDSIPQLNLHATSLAKSSKGQNKLVVPSLNSQRRDYEYHLGQEFSWSNGGLHYCKDPILMD